MHALGFDGDVRADVGVLSGLLRGRIRDGRARQRPAAPGTAVRLRNGARVPVRVAPLYPLPSGLRVSGGIGFGLCGSASLITLMVTPSSERDDPCADLEREEHDRHLERPDKQPKPPTVALVAPAHVDRQVATEHRRRERRLLCVLDAVVDDLLADHVEPPAVSRPQHDAAGEDQSREAHDGDPRPFRGRMAACEAPAAEERRRDRCRRDDRGCAGLLALEHRGLVSERNRSLLVRDLVGLGEFRFGVRHLPTRLEAQRGRVRMNTSDKGKAAQD